MTPTDFSIGSKVKVPEESIFRDDIFTVIGHTDEHVQVIVTLFGRDVQLDLLPDILTAIDSAPHF